MVIRYIIPDGYTVRDIKYDIFQNSDEKITCQGITQMATAPSVPMYPMNNGSDLLVVSKMADGFAMTNQNISGVNTEICEATAAVLAGAERQSLNILNSTERNGSDIRLAVERNGSDTRQAVERNGVSSVLSTERNGADTRSTVERNGANGMISTERNGGDTRQTVVQQASDIRNSVGDSRSLIQNSIRDATQLVSDKAAETLASVERNASENRATTYTQSAEGRIQTSANFALLQQSVSNECNDIETAVASTGTANALAAKDIQIQQLHVKADLAMQAAQNAANTRLDTYQSTKSVQEQLCRSELEAFKLKESLAAQLTAQTSGLHVAVKESELESYKHKEALAAQMTLQTSAIQAAVKGSEFEAYKHKEALSLQLQRAEIEALKAEARTAKALAECCCEIKEKVDTRASMTELLIKKEVENKLRDDNIVARLGGSGSALAVPAGYPGAPGALPYGYGAPYGGFPGPYGAPGVLPYVSGPRGRDGRDGRDGHEGHRHSRNSSNSSHHRHSRNSSPRRKD